MTKEVITDPNKVREIMEVLEVTHVFDAIIKLDAMVVEQEKRLNGHEAGRNALIESINKLQRQVDTYKSCAMDIAHELALHGSSDHKTKNEALLRAIARLMSFTSNYPTRDDMDDIPF
jgi:seryl-tRNA synthetase